MGRKYKGFEETSRYARYRDNLYIPQRKRVYLYWYKFLQEAERSDQYQVDWNCYKGWGGKTAILNQKFDVWWENRWKNLFSVSVRGEIPRYPLSTNQPKTEAIRLRLLIYQSRNIGTNIDIAQHVLAVEKTKKRYEKTGDHNSLRVDEHGNGNGHSKSQVQSNVGKHMRAAKKTLSNVCNGIFP